MSCILLEAIKSLLPFSWTTKIQKTAPLISTVSPEQSFPSPLVLWKPALHLQRKDPLVLLHMELPPQASNRHSLISVPNNKTILLASLFNICLTIEMRKEGMRNAIEQKYPVNLSSNKFIRQFTPFASFCVLSEILAKRHIYA